ncbi:MAG: hypothetical protein KTU85_00645 [Acidimicrobiia bacterium]|nr:hypothetical protein [Acidimicrobiia bacterium]MCY4457732.1 hypothetical protein [Acidimicrobiaceae bacterium]
MKKGRHRRYEEARELKRSHDGDFDRLLEDLDNERQERLKPEHLAWAAEFAEDLGENSSNESTNSHD